MLEEGSLNWDDTTAVVPASEYPDEVFDWDNPFELGPSIFGWTYKSSEYLISPPFCHQYLNCIQNKFFFFFAKRIQNKFLLLLPHDHL
jgi:hypothetical protein